MAGLSAVRILQVGLGGFGRDWAVSVIPQVSEVEVVGTADVFAGSRELAIAAGITTPERCFSTVEEALEATDPEAVLVTASLVGHVPAAEAALRSGRHVLIEKPFAPSVAEAKALVALADEQQRVVAVSQNYRFFPAVQTVRKIVADRDLGDLHAVEIDFRQFSGRDGIAGLRTTPWPSRCWWTCPSTTSTSSGTCWVARSPRSAVAPGTRSGRCSRVPRKGWP